MNAKVSVVGLGDDINGIIRVCPPPRDGESEACEPVFLLEFGEFSSAFLRT